MKLNSFICLMYHLSDNLKIGAAELEKRLFTSIVQYKAILTNSTSYKNLTESFFNIKTFKSLKEVMELFLNVKNFKSPKQVMKSFFGIKNFKTVMASFFRIKNFKSRKAVVEFSFSFKSFKSRQKVTVIVFFSWSHFIKLSYDDQISWTTFSLPAPAEFLRL